MHAAANLQGGRCGQAALSTCSSSSAATSPSPCIPAGRAPPLAPFEDRETCSDSKSDSTRVRSPVKVFGDRSVSAPLWRAARVLGAWGRRRVTRRCSQGSRCNSASSIDQYVTSTCCAPSATPTSLSAAGVAAAAGAVSGRPWAVAEAMKVPKSSRRTSTKRPPASAIGAQVCSGSCCTPAVAIFLAGTCWSLCYNLVSGLVSTRSKFSVHATGTPQPRHCCSSRAPRARAAAPLPPGWLRA